MALATVEILASGLHADGSYASPAHIVPAGASTVTFALDRSAWVNPALQVTFAFHLSIDGGAAWQYAGGFTAAGGAVIGPDGVAVTQSSATFSLPPNGAMQIKCAIGLEGGPEYSSGVMSFG